MPSTTSDLPSPGLEWQRFVPVPLRTVAEGSGMGCMCLPQPQGQSMAMGRLPSCLAMPVSAAQCSRALLASTAEVCGTPPPLARSDMPNRLFLLLGLLPVLLSSAVWVARPLLFIRLARTPGEHSQRSPDLSVWSHAAVSFFRGGMTEKSVRSLDRTRKVLLLKRRSRLSAKFSRSVITVPHVGHWMSYINADPASIDSSDFAPEYVAVK